MMVSIEARPLEAFSDYFFHQSGFFNFIRIPDIVVDGTFTCHTDNQYVNPEY